MNEVFCPGWTFWDTLLWQYCCLVVSCLSFIVCLSWRYHRWRDPECRFQSQNLRPWVGRVGSKVAVPAVQLLHQYLRSHQTDYPTGLYKTRTGYMSDETSNNCRCLSCKPVTNLGFGIHKLPQKTSLLLLSQDWLGSNWASVSYTRLHSYHLWYHLNDRFNVTGYIWPWSYNQSLTHIFYNILSKRCM